MSEQFCVSIIVPFYNAESHIKTCLDVLLNQDFTKPFEIIMVDDASTDNSQNIIKMHNFPGLRLYSLPLNSGPAAARNVVHFDDILTIIGGCIINHDYFKRLGKILIQQYIKTCFDMRLCIVKRDNNTYTELFRHRFVICCSDLTSIYNFRKLEKLVFFKHENYYQNLIIFLKILYHAMKALFNRKISVNPGNSQNHLY
jgi:glycosyltransferase involved in cell wall biosynthesis